MKLGKAELTVIGGGAAGLMCACTAAARGVDTVLLEPNRMLGRKLRITGKGRCNVTNSCDIKTFMANIPGDGRFLYSALNRLSPADTMAFFQDNGLPLKVERGNRVFPVSDNANDVAGLLDRLCRRRGVRVLHGKALEICTDQGAVTGVSTDQGLIQCRAAALCTGGLSYPLTGSDGTGYAMAEKLGHSVTGLRPSLVPLESGDGYCGEMQGFALKNVTLSAYENNRLIYKELGEMLFTHFGVSGPIILSASAHLRDLAEHPYELSIDLKPALSEEKLDARLLRELKEQHTRSFSHIMASLVPRALIPVLLENAGIPPTVMASNLTRQQRLSMVWALKHLPFTITGTRPIAEAIITSGGVSVKEIDPKTMQSKKCANLYFAGEVIDVDAYTGGFNLQIAFSTGVTAGRSME